MIFENWDAITNYYRQLRRQTRNHGKVRLYIAYENEELVGTYNPILQVYDWYRRTDKGYLQSGSTKNRGQTWKVPED